jgi:TPR repeat protein
MPEKSVPGQSTSAPQAQAKAKAKAIESPVTETVASAELDSIRSAIRTSKESRTWRERLKPTRLTQVLILSAIGAFIVLGATLGLFPNHSIAEINKTQTISVLKLSEQAYAAYQKGDFLTARQMWKQDAAKGDAHAQYNLGLLYAEGRGVVRNPKAAINWWHLAAKSGHTKAQHNLAMALLGREALLPGRIEDQKLAAATKWLEAASKSGLASSQYILAMMMLDRSERPENQKDAVRLLRAASDQGHTEAMYKFATCLIEGRGIASNPREGLALTINLARKGHARAQNRLGEFYYKGTYVVEDKIEALAWSILGGEQGNPDAAARQKLLVAELDDGEIAIARLRTVHLVNP